MRHILVWAYVSGGAAVAGGSQWFSSKKAAVAAQTILDRIEGAPTVSSPFVVNDA